MGSPQIPHVPQHDSAVTRFRHSAHLEVGKSEKKKPVIAWETTTGFRGGEGRNYINRELWGLERLTRNDKQGFKGTSSEIPEKKWVFLRRAEPCKYETYGEFFHNCRMSGPFHPLFRYGGCIRTWAHHASYNFRICGGL